MSVFGVVYAEALRPTWKILDPYLKQVLLDSNVTWTNQMECVVESKLMSQKNEKHLG